MFEENNYRLLLLILKHRNIPDSYRDSILKKGVSLTLTNIDYVLETCFFQLPFPKKKIYVSMCWNIFSNYSNGLTIFKKDFSPEVSGLAKK